MRASLPPGDSLPPGRGARESPSATLQRKLLGELRQFVVMFLYLWILFGLFLLNQVVTLEKHGMSIALNGFALINALVLAKVMMVVEYFDVARWLHSRPLAYAVVFESLLLAILFIAFHLAEHVVIGMFAGETLRQTVPIITGGGILGLLCVAAILFLSLLPFFAFKHLSRVLGASYVYAAFFGAREL